ncbi:MAG: DUF362 domain-containing protein [bacterium]
MRKSVDGKQIVSIVKCSDYTPANVEKAVEKAIDLIGGIKKFVKPKNKVLLKVNLLMPKPPSAGVTTHPAVMIAVAKLVKKAGGIVTIGDSSMWQTERALEICGVNEAAKEAGAKVINLDGSNPKKVKIKKGEILKEIYLSSKIFESDVIISVPKLKAHELTLLTGAVKNMFGVVPGRYKSQVHKNFPRPQQFSEALLDIFSVATPQLSVMDGVMSVQGSAGVGSTKKMKVILASDNAIALDTAAAKIIGYNPTELPINHAARKRGLSGTRLSEIQVKGVPISQVSDEHFRKPPFLMRWFMSNPQLNPIVGSEYRPVLSRAKCVRCGICAKHCPVEAINMKPYPVFNYDECIQCFCCREGCREGAITIREPLLSRLVSSALNFI